MNYLKYTTSTFLKLMAIIAVAFIFDVSFAYAQTPLSVDFETDPLFSETSILPGDGVTKTVTVGNYSKENQKVIVEAVNNIDSDGLGDVLNLVIKDGSTVLYNDTLGNFLRVGVVPLSVLSSAETVVYSFSVSFLDSANDITQSGVIDFDLCVGFEGGESNCGDTEIGGEGGTDDGGTTDGGGSGGGGGGTVTVSGGGSGGGGGGGILNTTRLKIKNERTTEVTTVNNPPQATATIEWDTNLLSTSQVIYGPATDGIGGPEIFYSLNLTVLPYFGYASGTVENKIKVTGHTVVLEGLVPGQVYKYRVISRASPPTVSYEHTFLASTAGGQGSTINIPSGGSAISNSTDNGAGAPVTGTSNPITPNTESETGNTQEQGNPNNGVIAGQGVAISDTPILEVSKKDEAVNGNLAAAMFGFSDFSGECALYLLLILFIIALLHRLSNRYLRGEIILNPDEVVTRTGLLFWISGILVSILSVYLMSYLCVITPLVALLGVLVVWYLIKMYRA